MTDSSADATFDLVVIGAGASGEAAASYAALRSVSVALIEHDLVGGACAYWACMPSKALLHAAAVRAGGGSFPWERASAFRDWLIARKGVPYPDDTKHAAGYTKQGIEIVRGHGRLDGPRTIAVTMKDGSTRRLTATRALVVASGSRAKVPPIPGLEQAGYWTNVEATSMRELPRSVIVLGAGPSGVEFAQYFVRFGVRTALVQSNERLNPTDHPRSSELLAKAFRKEGIDVRTGARAKRVRPGGGPDGEHEIELANGSTVSAERIAIGIGRTPNVAGLGLETVGVQVKEGEFLVADDRLRIADGVFAVGDLIGREISTHLGHYEGELAAKAALGEDVRPDLRAVPRCVYTDPELAAVGLQVAQAREKGYDAVEYTEDLAKSARGYVSEAEGHVTIVVDRKDRKLLGAFMAGPGATEAIHEAVLAVKLGLAVDVLEDTIHAFPTTARVFGTVVARAARELRGLRARD